MAEQDNTVDKQVEESSVENNPENQESSPRALDSRDADQRK